MGEDLINDMNSTSQIYQFIRECPDQLSNDNLEFESLNSNPLDDNPISKNHLLTTQFINSTEFNPSGFIHDQEDTCEKLTKGKQKIPIEFIGERSKRYSTFSKRKTGLMKKAVELAELTGAEVLLLIASETNHVYTFATQRLKGIIELECGKKLIQTCLSSNYPVLSGTTCDSNYRKDDSIHITSRPSVRTNFKRTMPISKEDLTATKLLRNTTTTDNSMQDGISSVIKTTNNHVSNSICHNSRKKPLNIQIPPKIAPKPIVTNTGHTPNSIIILNNNNSSSSISNTDTTTSTFNLNSCSLLPLNHNKSLNNVLLGNDNNLYNFGQICTIPNDIYPNPCVSSTLSQDLVINNNKSNQQLHQPQLVLPSTLSSSSSSQLTAHQLFILPQSHTLTSNQIDIICSEPNRMNFHGGNSIFQFDPSNDLGQLSSTNNYQSSSSSSTSLGLHLFNCTNNQTLPFSMIESVTNVLKDSIQHQCMSGTNGPPL